MSRDRKSMGTARAPAPQADRTAAPTSSRAQNPAAAATQTTAADTRWFGFLAAVTVLAVPLLYSYTARQAVSPDPFVYAQVAKEVVSGKRLYVDAWMDKPPLAILAYAVPQFVAPRSYRAIVVFGSLAIAAEAILFAFVFRGDRAASLVSALFLALAGMSDWDYVWPSTEHFSNLFVAGNLLLGFMIYRHRTFSLAQCLAIGALSCAAFHVRQNMVLSGLVPGLAVLLADNSPKEKGIGVLSIIAGGAAVWTIILGLVLWLGDLGGYWYVVFRYPKLYAAAGNAGELVGFATILWGGGLPFLIALAACLAAAGRYRALALSTLAIGVIGCLLPMRSFGHYIVNSFPYVAMLLALGGMRLSELDRRLAWALPVATAALLLPATALRMHFNRVNPRQLMFEKIAAAADQLAPEGGTLLVCGPNTCEAIQFASRLPAANTYFWMFQLQTPWNTMLPVPFEKIFDEYLADPPRVMVIEQATFDKVMREQEPAPMPEYLGLVRRLVRQHHYQKAANAGGHAILLRED